MKDLHSLGATVLGWLTTICGALAFVDWDTIDLNSWRAWAKLSIIVLPAIGGTVSSINKKDTKDEISN